PTHSLGTTYQSASAGNVEQTAQLDTSHGDLTLALGFGRTDASAVATAGAALRLPFQLTYAVYAAGWFAYDARLRRPPLNAFGTYYLSANVVKASEDKTFPGAVVASMASPWGQAVS